MPIAFDAVVSPDDMTEFTRDVPVDPTLQFLAEFPRYESDDNSINWGEIIRTNRTAKYRSWDGRIHVSERDGSSSKKVALAPLSTSLSQGEFETLQLEFARNRGTAYDRLGVAAYNDAERLTREIQARLELAWGDVLSDGILTINELGGAGIADFGVPANQKVAAATVWTDHDTATPLTDLEAWNSVYRAANGFDAGRIKTSRARRKDFLRSSEVIDAVFGSTAGRTRVTLTEANELLDGEGLPTFDEPYDTSVVVDDQEVRVFPENKLALLPADLEQLGSTAWGVTATALELVKSEKADMTFEEAAGIVGIIDQIGPPYREFVYVDAVAMPVLWNSRRLMIATVAA